MPFDLQHALISYSWPNRVKIHALCEPVFPRVVPFPCPETLSSMLYKISGTCIFFYPCTVSWASLGNNIRISTLKQLCFRCQYCHCVSLTFTPEWLHRAQTAAFNVSRNAFGRCLLVIDRIKITAGGSNLRVGSAYER